jgi:hypothetical protein
MMDPVLKSAALKSLAEDWSVFVSHYEALAPEAKEKFLRRQGFASFSALLAHIMAWWEEAIVNIRAVMENPAVVIRTYDVDRFNLEAVRAADRKTEPEVVREFEETRRRLVEAVSSVSESLVPNREIQKQFFWMITNHFAEHQQ